MTFQAKSENTSAGDYLKRKKKKKILASSCLPAPFVASMTFDSVNLLSYMAEKRSQVCQVVNCPASAQFVCSKESTA